MRLGDKVKIKKLNRYSEKQTYLLNLTGIIIYDDASNAQRYLVAVYVPKYKKTLYLYYGEENLEAVSK